MKKLIFFAMTCFAISVNAQIKMDANGNVAIGNYSPSSSYDLYVGNSYVSGSLTMSGAYSLISDWYSYGYRRIRPTTNNRGQLGNSAYAFNNVYSYNFTTISDERQKENVRSIQGSLNIVKRLEGVKYDFKREVYNPDGSNSNSKREANSEKERINKLGFIAQDVFEVLPEIVQYDDSTDIYAIDYMKLIPVLVEALKEQQLQIENMEDQLALVAEKYNKSPNARFMDDTSLPVDIPNSAQRTSLSQNTPNPSGGRTEIEYYISEAVSTAQLVIYNMQGTQLKSYEISKPGAGRLSINAGDFIAGMYMYSLVADGQLVDTKKMVLSK